MTQPEPQILPGQRVAHPEFGEGVVVDAPRNGYVRAFFPTGERQVPLASLRIGLSRAERILRNVAGTNERLRHAWLAYEAHALPLMESAAALTAAKVDLLPHQVVLTHRIATASPRRFLIADEVGLGKTIETALILRELASRGELKRAMMVVPAGLVNNWHRELNEVFHLDFEVFGSEGDVTDRKSNAFAKHDRLIASIDTLKRPTRIKRILEAPPWDLVVFDEAHHLTAYRSGNKVTKTENYKLAQALKDHTRDLLLLSATPHQGDHFRFWMLIQLLNPTLFKNADDMIHNRHRLNTVIFRRTKADGCRADGTPLFARRWVHTESFLMSDPERRFYGELRRYLEDGFALARRKGQQGRGLGFVMAIFQKIAASSFAAVRRTLRRRLLMLTIHEAVLHDQKLDIDGREALHNEARTLIHEEFGLADDPVSRGEVDRVLADLRVRLLKKLRDEEMELLSHPEASEAAADQAEDIATSAVGLALPEERSRIRALLAVFPEGRETKVDRLLQALGALWRQDSQEKVVIFATYLGTVDVLGKEIDATYPGQGVVVLRGGDHGAKLAAERRFRKKDGPKVLVCTAAGREGINLQWARILFNFDLPWNPMDVEQRIGRIHRYGQVHTAQVYNLVLSDTIEGRVFLLLSDKLNEIARTLGKVDEHGNVAEDFRAQILGQLSERLSYERLYQEALSDPSLQRTQLELEAALANASEARQVVSQLFQELEGFSLDDYRPFANIDPAVERLVAFLSAHLEAESLHIVPAGDKIFTVRNSSDHVVLRFTTDRDLAQEHDNLDLMGLDHPLIEAAIARWKAQPPEESGVSVQGNGEGTVVSSWLLETHGSSGDAKLTIQPIAVTPDGRRVPALESGVDGLFRRSPSPPSLDAPTREQLLHDHIEPMLQREWEHRNAAPTAGAFTAELISWVELS